MNYKKIRCCCCGGTDPTMYPVCHRCAPRLYELVIKDRVPQTLRERVTSWGPRLARAIRSLKTREKPAIVDPFPEKSIKIVPRPKK